MRILLKIIIISMKIHKILYNREKVKTTQINHHQTNQTVQ